MCAHVGRSSKTWKCSLLSAETGSDPKLDWLFLLRSVALSHKVAAKTSLAHSESSDGVGEESTGFLFLTQYLCL